MAIDGNEKRDIGLEGANGPLQNVAAINEAGNLGEGMSDSGGDGLRLKPDKNVKHDCEEALQLQQQRSQGSMVHWQTFLHVSSIKVLLVENDDSTRHVVAALLRNLNYEVIVAANGLQAWRILEDLSNHIDVVLTEVVMPCLSGVALLCKIMSHKTRKTVPVIMMSSHDSMGLVFKCLSKGAVDFLGKPIRKNELKNLWQHVWRRCYSSSGSGCESRTHTQLSVKSKSGIKYDKNNSSDENLNTGLKIGASNEDSDSQSSWTKEVDSSQAVSSKDQITKRSDSSAQLCSRAEPSTKFPATEPKQYQGIGDYSDDVHHGEDLVLGQPKTRELQLNSKVEVPFELLNTNRIIDSKLDLDSNKTSRANNQANHSLFNKDKTITARIPSPHTASKDHAKSSEVNIKAFDDSKVKAEIAHNLKRLRVAKDSGQAISTERNVIRCSDLSTFSRSKWYNTTSTDCKTSNVIDVSGSLEAIKDKSDIRTYSNRNTLCPSSEEIKKKVDIDLITDKLSINPAAVSKDTVDTTSNKLKATPAINDLNLTSVFAPTGLDLNCPPQQVILVKTDDLASQALLSPIRGSPSEPTVQHIHHHHHHVHHFHSLDREQPLSNLEKLPSKKPEVSPQSRSLNVIVGSVEGNTGICSLNKRGSGSKYGSNGQNGSSTVVHAGGTNAESEAYIKGNSENGDASGSANRNRIDSLTKFRHKKERRFDNKARSRNKKRPAE
ncbi:hypothetical protein ACET3Z_018539 [Daucus carota]